MSSGLQPHRAIRSIVGRSMSIPSSSSRVYEGVFDVPAINKPASITSAQVIRDAQRAFQDSQLFRPWFEREQARKDAESHNQRRKRRSWKQRQPLQVKMGHGGTLDPEATGVLILGVGEGTKSLGRFLECTKSYDAVLLFGAATDSYDGVGKLVARKPFEHITSAAVEEALSKFRGSIMQKPPIFSALRVQGKKLYEYAREGKEVPVEIQERPMQVEKMEMLKWLPGGTHDYHWPTEQANQEEKAVVEKVLSLGGGIDNLADADAKRKRESMDEDEQEGLDKSASRKRTRSSSPPNELAAQPSNGTPQPEWAQSQSRHSPDGELRPPCPAPACRLRMTVTSGFYVRSLCHDLGAAVGSLGLMANLVRTRQGDFELGTEHADGRVGVLDYKDLDRGEEVWGPKVQHMLDDWHQKEVGPVRRVPHESRSRKEAKDSAEIEKTADLRRNTSSESG